MPCLGRNSVAFLICSHAFPLSPQLFFLLILNKEVLARQMKRHVCELRDGNKLDIL